MNANQYPFTNPNSPQAPWRMQGDIFDETPTQPIESVSTNPSHPTTADQYLGAILTGAEVETDEPAQRPRPASRQPHQASEARRFSPGPEREDEFFTTGLERRRTTDEAPSNPFKGLEAITPPVEPGMQNVPRSVRRRQPDTRPRHLRPFEEE